MVSLPDDEVERRAFLSKVWWKARRIPDYDPKVWAHDDYGNAIQFGQYGNADSEYGWEIDHILPVSRGGGDEPSNLRPLQCRANRSRGAG